MSKTLLIQDQSKVRDFLNSVARNSQKTRQLYLIGLSHFQTFLTTSDKYSGYSVEGVLRPILKKQIDVYFVIDNYVSYLVSKHENKLSPNAILSYVASVRSYFLYHDIDIVQAKYKRRVKLPKNHREDEEPIDASDIRKILLSCNNRRLKAYLLVLASGGMRATEALAVRDMDCDFSVKPTKIHIRAEFAKTRVSRDVYISDEATIFLKEWLDFKYRQKGTYTIERSDRNLVFGKQRRSVNPQILYGKIRDEFIKILDAIKMSDKKEGMLRRRLTLHSYRRHAKSVISTQAGQDYSEWFLGHSKSPYWTVKEQERRTTYKDKIMPYLYISRL
jgi:integrase